MQALAPSDFWDKVDCQWSGAIAVDFTLLPFSPLFKVRGTFWPCVHLICSGSESPERAKQKCPCYLIFMCTFPFKQK